MPPVTIAGPNVSDTTDTGTTLSVAISENGTGYYLVQAAENTAPNVAAVLAGNSFAMTANSMVNQSITELSAAKLYKIYFVARDATNHVQAAVQSVAFTTLAAIDRTPPVTSVGPNVSATSDIGTTLSVTINEDGTGYYLVQAAAAAPPTVAAVQAGTAFAMSSYVAATQAIAGLTASTAYKVYFVAKDAANNVQAAVQSVPVTTTAAPDVTPPVTSSAPAISVAATDSTASVTQTINENGTGYYLVLLAASAAPTVAAVKAGTAFAMSAATPAVVALTGLSASTAYKYYFVAKDAANNDQAAVSTGLAITTSAAPDVTPPVTSSAPAISVAATDTTASVTQTINEAGTGYYLLLPAASAAPSVAAVKAGTAFAMSAATPAVVALTGLTASTAYKYYFVAKDAANNDQAAVQSVNVTTIAAADTTPDAFLVPDQTGVALSTVITSAPVTVTGINSPAAVTILGGSFSIAGGTYGTTGNVTNGQTVTVRLTSSASNSTTTSAVLNVGGVTDSFDVTTIAAAPLDTTPNTFDFTNLSNQALSTVVTTNTITVAGIDTAVTASTTVGTLVKNGVDTGLASTTVVAGDTLAVKLTTSASYNTTVDGTATIGTGATSTDNFAVVTASAALDTTPDAFAFTDQINVTPSTTVASDAITVSGINSPSLISVSAGEYSIDGGAYGIADSTVTNGQTVTVRGVAKTNYSNRSTPRNVVLTIGGVSDTFSITNIDGKPTGLNVSGDTFSWTAVSGAIKYMIQRAGDGGIQVNGVSFYTGVISGSWTVKAATSGTNWGVVSDSLVVANDTTPNTFDFTNLSNQALSTVVTTNTITVSGIDTAVTASTTVGTLVKNGVDTGLASTTVVAGDTLAVKLTTSGSFNTTVNGTATIGSGATSTDVFSVVTTNISAPTGVAISGSTLSWNLVVGANAYQVCWGGGASCQEVSAPTTSLGLLSGWDGVTLYVQASNDSGASWSPASLTVSYVIPTPATPTGSINSGNAFTHAGVNVPFSLSSSSGCMFWINGIDTGESVTAGGTWNTNFHFTGNTYGTGTGDGLKVFSSVCKKDGKSSAPLSLGVTVDNVVPNTPEWTAGVTNKSTTYPARKITLAVGPSGISPTGLSVTAGGTISNVTVSGGVITFDYTTPNAPGDTVTISGYSGSGVSFSVDLDTPALTSPP